MDFVKNLSIKQIITFSVTIILLIGIGFGVYLVQVRQVFKSKASIEGMVVKDSQGNIVSCDDSNTCITDSPQDVTITIEEGYYTNLKAPNP